MARSGKEGASLLRLALRGRPCALRLSLRGRPCTLRLALRGGRLWRLRGALRGRGRSGDVLGKLFEGDPSPVQVLLGRFARCSKRWPSLAQLWLRKCHGGRALVDLLLETAENDDSAGDEDTYKETLQVLWEMLVCSAENRPSLLWRLLEFEELELLKSKAQCMDKPSSLLRLLVSGSPPLLALVLDNEQNDRGLVLSILKCLVDGESTDGDSLARFFLEGPNSQSVVRFLLDGEDKGLPSLLRLFLNNAESIKDGESWFVLPEFLHHELESGLEVEEERLLELARELRKWLHENDIEPTEVCKGGKVAIATLCEVLFDVIFQPSVSLEKDELQSAQRDALIETLRVACLGDGQAIDPILNALFIENADGIYEVPALLLLGVFAGLRVKTLENTSLQYLKLRQWQDSFAENVALLGETSHRDSEWTRNLLAVAQSIGHGGNLEARFLEVASSVASPDEVIPGDLRAIAIFQALLGGNDSNINEKWRSHFNAVLAKCDKASIRPFLEALRDKDWTQAIRISGETDLVNNFEFVTMFSDLETFLAFGFSHVLKAEENESL